MIAGLTETHTTLEKADLDWASYLPTLWVRDWKEHSETGSEALNLGLPVRRLSLQHRKLVRPLEKSQGPAGSSEWASKE